MLTQIVEEEQKTNHQLDVGLEEKPKENKVKQLSEESDEKKEGYQ